LHDDFEDLAGLVLKEAVVREHDCCAPAGAENVDDMLDEVELLASMKRHRMIIEAAIVLQAQRAEHCGHPVR
jgi:hypothetical protein